LDGLEKAERNVLPTLKNLLENREMNLEDGRLLVSAQRYQELETKVDSAASSFVVPVHSEFRVLALCVPVPLFTDTVGGKSFDPPLRSRFLIRRIDNPSAEDLLMEHDLGLDSSEAQFLAAFAGAMETAAMSSSHDPHHHGERIWSFPSNTLSSRAKILDVFRQEDCSSLLARCYPHAIPEIGSKRDGLRNALNRTLRFSLLVYQGQIGQFLFRFQIAKELLLKMHMRL
jgi:hypothetical protein